MISSIMIICCIDFVSVIQQIYIGRLAKMTENDNTYKYYPWHTIVIVNFNHHQKQTWAKDFKEKGGNEKL